MSKIKIEGNSSGTGTLTISAPNTNTDRTLTLPDGAGEILLSDGDGSGLTGIESNFVLLDSGDNLTSTVAAYDFDLDVSTYDTHVIYFTGWNSVADGSNLYFDLLWNNGANTYSGWYGGNHMVGESNSGNSNSFSNQAYARPFFGFTTNYVSNTYNCSGRIEISSGGRYTMTWQIFARMSSGLAQHCVGGAVSTTNPSNTVTGFRLSMSQNSDGLKNYRVFGVK